MTGVDPASVRIYRGPLAERVTATQNADALTDGGAIALGAGHATDTPETLGLLAHELTHVAQRRTPRFVPPIAQVANTAPCYSLSQRCLQRMKSRRRDGSRRASPTLPEASAAPIARRSRP